MNINRLQKTELKQCNRKPITACELSDLQKLVNNPAGTARPDVKNSSYPGKVNVRAGLIHINLSFVLTGNINRAEIGLNDLRAFFKENGITANFSPSPSKPDLRIHGANLTEIVHGLKICTCEEGLLIGGWAPNPTHPTWGNALLLSTTSPRAAWKIETGHEFFHKLGLKHRRLGGIMDYVDPNKPDRRKFLPSERQRIIDLYK